MASRFSVRRLFRFSLRTLLLLLTALSVVLAYWSNGAHAQRQAVATLERCNSNCSITYAFQREWRLHQSSTGRALPMGLFGRENPPAENQESWVPGFIYSSLGADFFETVVSVELRFVAPRGANESKNREAWQALCGLAGLEELISFVPATDVDMAALSQLRRLKTLQLQYPPELSDEGFRALARCRSLQSLWLTGDRFQPGSLARLARAPSLTKLTIEPSVLRRRADQKERRPTDVGDDPLKEIASFPRLESLTIKSDRITDDGLRCLAQLATLRTLDLSGEQLSGAGLVDFQKLPRLETVSLATPRLTDDDIGHLASIPQLRSLWLSKTQVTAKGLQRLHEAQRLESLSVYPRPSGDLAELQAALPPNCKLLTK